MKAFKKILLGMAMLVLACSLSSPALAKEVYTVKPGDSLLSISLKHDTTIHKLKKANQLSSLYLEIGQMIKIPEVKNKNINGYISMPGDSLYQSILQLSPTTQTLFAANSLAETALISTKALKRPKRAVVASRSTPRPVIPYDDKDLDLLARIIAAESRGEPMTGQIGVGAVVINRVQSPQFPNSLKDVIYQPGQFGPARTGKINKPAPEYCFDAAKKALLGADPTNGALYFFDTGTNSRFLWSLPVAFTHGNLIFAYPK
ncbi:MAG: LysM peptidoglycan-binding domain-containing protein [Firmicutes bacterium]|nr:LysM peptidoglycan-binding domain-containing protein [Bacillota bacterium]